MNATDYTLIYMSIMSVVGTYATGKYMINRIRKLLSSKPATAEVTSEAKPQKVYVNQPVSKVDRRNKFTVNVDACEAYLASRKTV